MSKLWFSGEIMPEAGCYSSPLSQDAFSRKDPFADQKGYFSLRLHFQIQGNTTVPKKEEFYSRLNDSKISGEHYGHGEEAVDGVFDKDDWRLSRSVSQIRCPLSP